MRAGSLDRRIGLALQMQMGPNAFNESVAQNVEPTIRAWTWAAVKETTGREFLAAEQQLVGERRAVFTIRYRIGLSTAWFVYYGQAYWNIVSVREIGRRQGLEIQAVAR